MRIWDYLLTQKYPSRFIHQLAKEDSRLLINAKKSRQKKSRKKSSKKKIMQKKKKITQKSHKNNHAKKPHTLANNWRTSSDSRLCTHAKYSRWLKHQLAWEDARFTSWCMKHAKNITQKIKQKKSRTHSKNWRTSIHEKKKRTNEKNILTNAKKNRYYVQNYVLTPKKIGTHAIKITYSRKENSYLRKKIT